MSYDTEEQVDTGSIQEDETIETVDDTTTDETNQDDEATAKKNKSNWKKVSEKAKRAEALEAELAKAKEELEAWRSENPDIIKETLSKSSDSSDKLEKRLFLIENPGAKEHLEKIDAIVAKSKGGIDREEAWLLIKDSVPKESTSKTDFSTKSVAVNSKKNLASITDEEAVKLDKATYAKWAEMKGYI